MTVWTGTPRVQTEARPGLTLWVRHALCDETVIDEVITRDCYRVANLDLTGQTVIDCGAHIGVFSTMCAQQGARVVAVEPQPENLELLLLNTAAWPQINVQPIAVGASTGTAFMAGESGGAHIEPGHPGAIATAQTTLAVLLDDWAPGHVDILKLDMEGSEADALLACDHDHLKRVSRVVMETHGPISCPWLDRPRVGEVVEHLLPTHNLEVSGFPSHLGLLFAERNGCA